MPPVLALLTDSKSGIMTSLSALTQHVEGYATLLHYRNSLPHCCTIGIPHHIAALWACPTTISVLRVPGVVSLPGAFFHAIIVKKSENAVFLH